MKYELKLLFLFAFIFTLFLTTESVQAHSGRTDGYGGHTCNTNCEQYGLSYGQYHYHNGGGGRGFDWGAFLERCQLAIENDPTLISVSDTCLSDYGLSIKQKSIEEEERRLEEERLIRLKKQRENKISNWIAFLSLLFLLRLYFINSDYYKLLFSKAAKSGSWIFFLAVYFLNKKFPITFDWNGIEKLRIVFLVYSSLFIFKLLEDTFYLSDKISKLKANIFFILKSTYKFLITLLEKLKFFDLINLFFKILSFFITLLSRFLLIFRMPLEIFLSLLTVLISAFFPAIIYGIFGMIVFSIISYILSNLFSFNFEFVAALIFSQADVSGLNEIATFLSGLAGFLISFIFYFFKNFKELKDNFLTEYSR